jgi:acyl-CoA thioester hydrolase
MGVVHHASYLVYFEVGRVELARRAGTSYAALEDGGYSLAVSQIEIKYHLPARFDQELVVRTQVNDIRSRGITFGYEIVDVATGRLLVSGISRHICIDRSGAVRHIPAFWAKAIGKFAAEEQDKLSPR